MNQADVIVVGLGVMGCATCRALAKRGRRVLGLEQFDIPNAMGSSHGDTRAIRRLYFEHPDYVPLLEASFDGWRELEVETGMELVTITGVLHMGAPDGDMIRDCTAVAEQHEVPFEVLSRDDIRHRFPQFEIPDDHIGLFEPGGGFLRAERGVESFAASARRHGAALRTGASVTGWRATDDGVEVDVDGATVRAERLIITAGAWASSILRDASIPLTVTRQVLSWNQPRDPREFGPGHFPVFSIDDPDGILYYGFPSTAERAGMKFARHHIGGPSVEPDALDRTYHDSDRDALWTVLRRFVPRAAGAPLDGAVCMYTNTPDGQFVIDRHPACASVCFGSGFSGHGFKFAPVIGEALADLAEFDSTRLPMDFLRLNRFQTNTQD